MISRIANIKNEFLKYMMYRIFVEKTKLIILCVCGVVGFPIFALAASHYNAVYGAINDYPDSAELLLGISVILMFAAVAVMTIVCYIGGITKFEYYSNRLKVDKSWTLPVKAKNRFWGDFAAGIIPVSIVYTISAAIGLIIISIGLYGSTNERNIGFDFNYETIMGMAIAIAGMGLLFLISLYCISVFCATLCGRIFEAAVYPILICGMIPAIIWLVGSMLFNGAWQIDITNQLMTALQCSSPFGFLIGGVYDMAENAMFTISGEFNGSPLKFVVNHTLLFRPLVMILFVVINAIFLAGAYFFGKKRVAENTGTAFTSKLASEIVMSLIMFAITAVFAYMLASEWSWDFGPVLFGAFMSSAIVFLFLDVTAKRGFKRMGSALVRYVAMMLGSTVISIALLSANGFGIGSYVPPLEEIKSVSVDVSYGDHDTVHLWGWNYNYSYNLYGGREIDRTVFTQSDNIERMRNIHIQSNNGEPKIWWHGETVQITYTLNNGKQVRRFADITAKTDELLWIYVSDEYKQGFIKKLEIARKRANMTYFEITALASGADLYSSQLNPTVDFNKVYEAFKRDYLSETFEQRYQTTGKNLGSIRFVMEQFDEENGWNDVWQGGGGAYIVIRPYYTNLINELLRQNIDVFGKDEIERFGEGVTFELLEQQDMIGIVNYRWFWNNGDVSAPVTVVLNGETAELLQKVFDVMQPSYLVNGRAFVFRTWHGQHSDFIIPPEYEDLAKELWEIAIAMRNNHIGFYNYSY